MLKLIKFSDKLSKRNVDAAVCLQRGGLSKGWRRQGIWGWVGQGDQGTWDSLWVTAFEVTPPFCVPIQPTICPVQQYSLTQQMVPPILFKPLLSSKIVFYLNQVLVHRAQGWGHCIQLYRHIKLHLHEPECNDWPSLPEIRSLLSSDSKMVSTKYKYPPVTKQFDPVWTLSPIFDYYQKLWNKAMLAASVLGWAELQNLFKTSQINIWRQCRLHFTHFCCFPFHVVLCSPLIKGWLPLEDISRLRAASSQCDDKPQRNPLRSWKRRGPRREAGPSNKTTPVYSFVFYSSHYLPLALLNCSPLPSCLLYFFH